MERKYFYIVRHIDLIGQPPTAVYEAHQRLIDDGNMALDAFFTDRNIDHELEVNKQCIDYVVIGPDSPAKHIVTKAIAISAAYKNSSVFTDAFFALYDAWYDITREPYIRITDLLSSWLHWD